MMKNTSDKAARVVGTPKSDSFDALVRWSFAQQSSAANEGVRGGSSPPAAGGILISLFFLLFFPSSLPAWGAVSIVDDSGAAITLAEPARRVVPLYAGLGELLAALGAGDFVVGRTPGDESAPGAPIIGTHMRPDLERIAALSPDLAVQVEGRDEAAAAAEALQKIGVPTARFRITNYEDLFSCIRRLGVLTGREREAEALTRAYRDRLEAVRRKAEALPAGPSVFFEVRYPNLLGAGGDNMTTAIIAAAGGRNVFADRPGKILRLNEEAVIAANPDVYLQQVGPMNKNPSAPAERPGYAALVAVREGRVCRVPEEIFSRPGPSSVTAAETLVEIFTRLAEQDKADAAKEDSPPGTVSQ